MRHTITIAGYAVLVALLACKSAEQKPEPGSATPEMLVEAGAAEAPKAKTPPKPDVVVSITELLEAYEANELAADNKFKGKLVAFAGKIADVKKDILDDAYVTIGTGKSFEIPQAQCYFAKGEEGTLATLSKGQVIGVICRGDGLMMNVQMKDCVLVRDRDGGVYTYKGAKK